MTPDDLVTETQATPDAASRGHTIEDVISRGMCVGCGACSVATGGAITITLGRRRSYEADASQAPADALRAASRVCPFSDESRNEDAIAKDRFAGLKHDERIGYYIEAEHESRRAKKSGADLTPFLLREIALRSDNKSIASNCALLLNNARLAAEIAKELSILDKGAGF